MINGKKFPLSIGIKSAKNETLLLTDADCVPASEHWMQLMQDGYDDDIAPCQAAPAPATALRAGAPGVPCNPETLRGPVWEPQRSHRQFAASETHGKCQVQSLFQLDPPRCDFPRYFGKIFSPALDSEAGMPGFGAVCEPSDQSARPPNSPQGDRARGGKSRCPRHLFHSFTIFIH